MTKEELKELMDLYNISDIQEAFAAIEFVNDLLYQNRKRIEKDCPDDVRKIEDIKVSEWWTWEMLGFIQRIVDGDYDE